MFAKVKAVSHEQAEKSLKILYYFIITIYVGSVLEFGCYWSMGLFVPMLFSCCCGKDRKKFALLQIPMLCAAVLLGVYMEKLAEGIALAAGLLITAILMKRANSYADSFFTMNSYFVKIFKLLFPLFLLLLVESMQQNTIRTLSHLFSPVDSADANGVVFHMVAWMNVAFVWILWWIVFAVSRRAQLAVVFVGGVLFLLGFVNLFVLHFTSQPFLPTDIFIFKTAMNVMGTQTFTWKLGIRAGGALILFIMFLIVYWKIYRTTVWEKKKQTINGIITVFLVMFLNFAFQVDYLNFQGHLNYGFVFYFFSQIYAQQLTEPVGYVEEEALPNTEVSEKGKTELSEKPNVIIIMNEAFSDLTLLGEFEVSEDPIPYFHSLLSDYPNGVSYASVYGNNTISSEFECLTGITTGLTTKAANLYTRYLPENMYSLSEYFSSLDYKTVFFHPGIANSYNRENIYRLMGFDETVFLDDLPKQTDTLRGFVTDAADYQKVTELIETEEEPLFLMNTTIQNHGDYNQDITMSPSIKLKDMEEQKDTELYLSLLKQSDEALQTFISSIEEIQEPTVVLFFGDHQPLVGEKFYETVLGKEEQDFSLEDQVKKYQVPYLLWANYDLPNMEVPKVTSHNYLSLILLDAIRFPSTEWMDFLRELREEYPVITEVFVKEKDKEAAVTEKYKERLKTAQNEEYALSLLKQYEKACYGFVTREKE